MIKTQCTSSSCILHPAHLHVISLVFVVYFRELERLQQLKIQAEEAKADEQRMAQYSQNTRRSLANVNESIINFDLIANLIYSLMTQR